MDPFSNFSHVGGNPGANGQGFQNFPPQYGNSGAGQQYFGQHQQQQYPPQQQYSQPQFGGTPPQQQQQQQHYNPHSQTQYTQNFGNAPPGVTYPNQQSQMQSFQNGPNQQGDSSVNRGAPNPFLATNPQGSANIDQDAIFAQIASISGAKRQQQQQQQQQQQFPFSQTQPSPWENPATQANSGFDSAFGFDSSSSTNAFGQSPFQQQQQQPQPQQQQSGFVDDVSAFDPFATPGPFTSNFDPNAGHGGNAGTTQMSTSIFDDDDDAGFFSNFSPSKPEQESRETKKKVPPPPPPAEDRPPTKEDEVLLRRASLLLEQGEINGEQKNLLQELVLKHDKKVRKALQNSVPGQAWDVKKFLSDYKVKKEYGSDSDDSDSDETISDGGDEGEQMGQRKSTAGYSATQAAQSSSQLKEADPPSARAGGWTGDIPQTLFVRGDKFCGPILVRISSKKLFRKWKPMFFVMEKSRLSLFLSRQDWEIQSQTTKLYPLHGAMWIAKPSLKTTFSVADDGRRVYHTTLKENKLRPGATALPTKYTPAEESVVVAKFGSYFPDEVASFAHAIYSCIVWQQQQRAKGGSSTRGRYY